MTVSTSTAPRPLGLALRQIWKRGQIWWITALILIATAVLDAPREGLATAGFAGWNLLEVAPYLVLSILIAAYAGATDADGLIARAFSGTPLVMILVAALAGGLSPFCSCGVIPLIAALLAMGVPLSAVMAFWLASPVMDPSMFVLTTGALSLEFAIAKTLAAVGLGIGGGLLVHLLSGAGRLSDPLREGVGNGGCGGGKVRRVKPIVWRFWQQPDRTRKFGRETWKNTEFLAKWLLLAFVLEHLMLTHIPAESITGLLGGEGLLPIGIATLVGVPAYLNGYAALPLVNGLIEQGMQPGAGLAFLVAGGVTSIPAAIAVWALVKRPVFLLYIGISLGGSFLLGLVYQAWTML